MTLAEFREGVQVRVFGHGKMGSTVRVDHPSMPGLPILGLVDPSESIEEKTEKCVAALYESHLENAEWSLL